MKDLKERREATTPTTWRRGLPPHEVLSPEGMWVLGTYSYTNRNLHTRLADKTDTIFLAPYIYTPSELARDYLTYRYGKARRICKEQWRLFRNTAPAAPLYAKPGLYRDYQYVDLKAAYWSIVNLVGWDVDYMPERWLSYGDPPSDFPAPNHKASRSALVSATRRSVVMVKTGENVYEKSIYNPLWNDSLWYVVMHILHMIALKALALGAVYVHTDGYMLPAENVQELRKFIEAHGLTLGEKTYPRTAHICQLQNWQIGDLKTKRYDPLAYPHHTDTLIRDLDFTALSRSLRYRAEHPLAE